MKKIVNIVLGDIHGEFHVIQDIIDSHKNYCKGIIQVGDFGYGFDKRIDDKLFDLRIPPNFSVEFIDGNHDNSDLLYQEKILLPNTIKHIKRGTIKRVKNSNVLFIGGAGSIDRSQRLPGRDWWVSEMPNHQQQNKILDTISTFKDKIDFVITHDCPTYVHTGFDIGDDRYCWSMREFLTEVYLLTRPYKWFFGHYHETKETQYENTIFQCVGINEIYYQKF